MKFLASIALLLLINCSLFAQSSFQGILRSQVSILGVDMSEFTRKLDYSKPELASQFKDIYQSLDPAKRQKLETLLQSDPSIAMLLALTPPQGTLYIDGDIALAKIIGLGYQVQHYHNMQEDKALIYTASLIDPQMQVTASYSPKQSQKLTLEENRHITPENFTRTLSDKTVQIAGYTCSISTYRPKQAIAPQGALPLSKLLVYSSEQMPKTINFSHPYYLPEEQGILKIEAFLENQTEPILSYTISSVNPQPIGPQQLAFQQSSPLFSLTDMEYSAQVLQIMFSGMHSLSLPQEQQDDDENVDQDY